MQCSAVYFFPNRQGKPVRPMSLNADLLWKVLMKHVEDKELTVSSRLTCIKRCTHVCSAWRQLILGWPSIWAKLLIMNHNQNKYWTEEILKRSRFSPLHLSAEFLGGPLYSDREDSVRELFYTTVEENWERMEVFSLTIIGELSVMHMSRKLWSTFQRPAPLLQEFHIQVRPYHQPGQEFPPEEDFDTSIIPLFSNRAPFLQQFKSALRRVSFNYPPSWCRTLCTLSMFNSNGMSLFKIMEILQHTPLLESFHTDSLAFGEDDFERRHTANFCSLNLPSLSSISLHMTLHQFTTFISHLQLKKKDWDNVQCTIHVPGYIPLPDVVNFLRCFKQSFNDLLSGYKHRHWKFGGRELSASLCIDTTGSILLTWPGPYSSPEASFIVDFLWTFPQLPVHRDEGMKEAYSSLISSSFDDLSNLSLTFYSKGDEHFMYYLPLLQSFSSVSTLAIYGTFLESFWKSFRSRWKEDPTISYPFRNVHTLQTIMFSTWVDSRSFGLENFFDFLRGCYDQGVALYRLQLLERLTDVTGLSKVIEQFGDLEISWIDIRGREIMYTPDFPEPMPHQ